MTTILAPISIGELVDKITILMIKQQRITDPNKLENVNKELTLLLQLLNTLPNDDLENIQDLLLELKSINMELWDIENYKRACETIDNFDLMFIDAARKVYIKNDLRAAVKRKINDLCASDIVEEKQHTL
jgi:hypothetical protein